MRKHENKKNKKKRAKNTINSNEHEQQQKRSSPALKTLMESHLKVPKRARALSVHNALGDALAVEVRQVVDEGVVLSRQDRRTTRNVSEVCHSRKACGKFFLNKRMTQRGHRGRDG